MVARNTMRIAIHLLCDEKVTAGAAVMGLKRQCLFRFMAVLMVIQPQFLAGCTGRQGFSGQYAYGLAEKQMEFGPRPPGSEALKQTGDWIAGELREQGWDVEEQTFLYKDVQLRNVIGIWEPEHLASPDSMNPIILGAHYDTRPHADLDPVDPLAPVPGANDGASGVAVLLEMARVIRDRRYSGSVLLVFFDAEDSGRIDDWDWIVGSSYYADRLAIEPQAVVIVDMVGDKDLDLYYEQNSDAELSAEIWEIADELGYDEFVPEKRYSILDDHIPFLERGWRAVDIIDFDYPAWHTQGDTLDKISAQSLEAVGVTLEHWLWARAAVD